MKPYRLTLAVDYQRRVLGGSIVSRPLLRRDEYVPRTHLLRTDVDLDGWRVEIRARAENPRGSRPTRRSGSLGPRGRCATQGRGKGDPRCPCRDGPEEPSTRDLRPKLLVLCPPAQFHPLIRHRRRPTSATLHQLLT